MELGLRKQQIVSAIVDAYIRTGEPIGSKALVAALDGTVSSATIRIRLASESDMLESRFMNHPRSSLTSG